jgi:ribosomal protein S14
MIANIMATLMVLKTGNFVGKTVAVADKDGFREVVGANQIPGFRYSFVSFKAKSGLQSFAAQVPTVALSDILATAKGTEFVEGLIADYQDSLLRKVVEAKELGTILPRIDSVEVDGLTVSALNVSAMVADYFDTTRDRSGITREQVMEWVKNVWTEAFATRQVELNPQIPTERITMMVTAYSSYFKAICGRQSGLAKEVLISCRQVLTKLTELGKLPEDDPITEYLIEKIASFMQEGSKAQILADAV